MRKFVVAMLLLLALLGYMYVILVTRIYEILSSPNICFKIAISTAITAALNFIFYLIFKKIGYLAIILSFLSLILFSIGSALSITCGGMTLTGKFFLCKQPSIFGGLAVLSAFALIIIILAAVEAEDTKAYATQMISLFIIFIVAIACFYMPNKMAQSFPVYGRILMVILGGILWGGAVWAIFTFISSLEKIIRNE